jgi:hypothetical protein
MTSFDVEVYRDGKWWMADIASLDLLTQSRRLANIDAVAREAIAVTLDANPDSFSINVKMRPIGEIDVDALRDEIDHVQAAAAELERTVAAKSKELTQSLAKAGVPVRDIGTIIGLSHQRAHQLVHEESGAGDAGVN